MKEYSYGIIPLRKEGSTWQVFLVKKQGNYWGYPKGHAEKDETPLQSALRELQEETGLRVISYLSCPPLQTRYHFYKGQTSIDKSVIYFTALVHGSIQLEIHEIDDGQWLTLEKALDILTFNEDKSLLTKVQNILETLNSFENKEDTFHAK